MGEPAELAGKSAVVTGAKGFIGKHLVKALQEASATVAELDLPDFDATDLKSLLSVKEADLVFHLAAKTDARTQIENPVELFQANTVSTLNALELARQRKAKLVFVSSYVYGKPEYLPIDEKHPVKPHNPYTESKLLAEAFCKAYSRQFGLPVAILRPFNVFGPGQRQDFVIAKIAAQAKESEKIELDSLLPKRDFLFVSDAVNALLKAALHKSRFEVFNIGAGKSHSIREIVELAAKASGKELKPISKEEKEPGIPEIVADCSKAKKLLNWKPEVSIEEGLKKTLS